MGVLAGNDDRGFLNFDEAGAGAQLQLCENVVDLFAGLDELDFDGQIVGDLEDVSRVDAVRLAEAGDAFDDGRAGNAAVKEEVEDAGIDGDSVVLCSIAEIDGDFDGFSGRQHEKSFLELALR